MIAESEAQNLVLERQEIIDLSLFDYKFYTKHWFPQTFRQPMASFHPKMWEAMEDPLIRYLNIQVMRDGAKTTLLRAFTSKRVAFNLSHTILYIGKSEGHAVRSIRWLQKQMEFNHEWRNFFGLVKGSTWSDGEIRIENRSTGEQTWVVAAGINGSIRGLNFDDYRPDLIIVDDVIDDENAGTLEQRQKYINLIHGAVKASLAPVTENPNAKMVLLQTPLDEGDASTELFNDPEWTSLRFPCWTLETEDAPLTQQVSAWPERYPSEGLRKDKQNAIAKNRYHIFAREKELRLVTSENTAFHGFNLKHWSVLPDRSQMKIVMWIDPVPPPSEQQIAKNLQGKDYEAFAVVGAAFGKFFLLHYVANRGHEPDWTINTFFNLAAVWRPREIYVEAVAYQRTLATTIRKAMLERRKYYNVIPITDRRKKYDRIVDGLTNAVSNGVFYCHPDHSDFISQFQKYPKVAHDDVLEAVASATEKLELDEFEESADEEDQDDVLENIQFRRVP